MVWCALILSFASLALSVVAVIRRGERASRPSHIEIPPEVVQHESAPAPSETTWSEFDAKHRAAFERAVNAHRARLHKREVR